MIYNIDGRKDIGRMTLVIFKGRGEDMLGLFRHKRIMMYVNDYKNKISTDERYHFKIDD